MEAVKKGKLVPIVDSYQNTATGRLSSRVSYKLADQCSLVDLT